MKKMQMTDVFNFVRCIKAIGIKDEVMAIARERDTWEDALSAGFELFWNIFDRASEKKGEKILYGFFAEIFETTPDELAQLPPIEFMDGLKQIAEENDLKGFFASVKSLMSALS